MNKNKQKLKRNTKRKPLITRQTRELSDFIVSSKDSSGIKRAQAVLMLADNQPLGLIDQITGFGRSQAFNWRKIYDNKGLPGIQSKPRKVNRLLTKTQREELAETLKVKTPKDLGLSQDYWTTGLLGHYVNRQYQVAYKSKTSYYLIFKDSKSTFHKPGRVYQRHNEQEVKEWKTANKDRIKQAHDFIKQDGNIEVIEFPSTAPEENPQEHVWKAGRSQTTHNQFITDIDQTTDSFINYLNTTTFDYDFLGLKAEAKKIRVRV